MNALLTTEDLARVLATTPAAIRQLRFRGAPLPPAVLIGRRLLWRPDDVEAWISSNVETNAIDPARGGAAADLSAVQKKGSLYESS